MDRAFTALVRFRDRMRYAWPQNWPLSAAAGLALFIGYWTYDGQGASSASVWLLLGAFALFSVKGHTAVQATTELTVVGGLFAFVFVIGLFQLTPGGFGLAHPMWALVDATGAITLDRTATIRELLQLLALGAAFLVGVMLGRNDRRARLFLSLAMVGGVGFAALSALGPTAVTGPAAGLVFSVITLLGYARLLQAVREAFDRQLTAPAFARAAALGLITTVAAGAAAFVQEDLAGRVGLLAALLGLSAWEFRAARGRYAWATTAMTAAGVAFAGAAFATILALSAVFTEAEGARLAAAAAYGRAVLAAPVFGYGFGGFPDVNSMIQTAQNWTALEGATTAGNLYLQWLLEAGALATLAMAAALVVLITLAARASEWRKRMRSWLRAIVVVSAWILVDGAASGAVQAEPVALLWASLLGVSAGLAATKTAGPRRV